MCTPNEFASSAKYTMNDSIVNYFPTSVVHTPNYTLNEHILNAQNEFTAPVQNTQYGYTPPMDFTSNEPIIYNTTMNEPGPILNARNEFIAPVEKTPYGYTPHMDFTSNEPILYNTTMNEPEPILNAQNEFITPVENTLNGFTPLMDFTSNEPILYNTTMNEPVPSIYYAHDELALLSTSHDSNSTIYEHELINECSENAQNSFTLYNIYDETTLNGFSRSNLNCFSTIAFNFPQASPVVTSSDFTQSAPYDSRLAPTEFDPQ
ncbi:5562_t:CDS:1 [Acaulospora colombiana]|uniref:5562_t:CDS:1 n=1 Tax=Acaulospora colombiana TaxID=27376 RepID=A0ACA9KEC7_9GLOM|nr:5562_t:CDS:1 [Acaulospora colombiana]